MPNESDIAQDTSNHVSRITHDHDRAGTRNGVPDPLPRQGRYDPNRHRTFLSALEHLAEEHLNFYRIHLLFFTIVPLAFAGVFYAVSREDNPVSFIDSLFLCVSAITVAGLYPIVLSNISVGQQVILVILTAMGGVTGVSVVMVLIRRHYFARDLARRLDEHVKSKKRRSSSRHRSLTRRPSRLSTSAISPPIRSSTLSDAEKGRHPVLLKDGLGADYEMRVKGSSSASSSIEDLASIKGNNSIDGPRRDEKEDRIDVDASTRTRDGTASVSPFPSLEKPETQKTIPSSDGIRFDTYARSGPTSDGNASLRKRNARGSAEISRPGTAEHSYNRPLERTWAAKDRGFGGFGNPLSSLPFFFRRMFPAFHRGMSRRLTVPQTTTLQSAYNNSGTTTSPSDPNGNVKVVPYITFDAIVGNNSNFYKLTEAQREELGGLEYKALNMLAWLVPAYWIGYQGIAFVMLAPYMSMDKFHDALTQQPASVNPTWYSLFQVVSSFANNGMSLVDASLVPLQTAWVLIITMIILILAGNTAFPVFLRFTIWILAKIAPKNSQTYATARFLLDHPRRCFLYLFPSTQTWYLVAVLFILNCTDWVLFLILDIGNSAIEVIPVGTRIMAGLFQAAAVRCGGFQIVALGQLAPAVQVLYVAMMYVGAYPLALSVRSTNVYEERSIALYNPEESDEEPKFPENTPKHHVWGGYIAWHAKRQLAFDVWWLAFALWLICIIERGKILDPENYSWLNVFTLLFEIVSAYGTVGLSLGVPNENFSLSGALGTLSKLILCAVMVRGRHRGLPAAIDRSVLLPSEIERERWWTSPSSGGKDAVTRVGDQPRTVADVEKGAVPEPEVEVGPTEPQG